MTGAAAASADPRYALVFAESLRALREQQDALKDVRAHAGQLLAAASVVASFLGGLVLRSTPSRPPLWVAVVSVVAALSFLALVADCIWIVLPRHGWVFVNSATVLIEGYVEADAPADIDKMHRQLALWMERHWDHNQEALNARLTALQVAAGLLAVAIGAWCAALIGR
jgi:hypothetical protein